MDCRVASECWKEISRLIELYQNSLIEDMMTALSSTMLLRISCFKRAHSHAFKIEYVDSIDTSLASIGIEYPEDLVELCLQLAERAMRSHGRAASVESMVKCWSKLIAFIEPKRFLSSVGNHARKLALQSMFRMLDLESPAEEVTIPDSQIFVTRLQVTKERKHR